MSKINENYQVEQGEHGLMVITYTGRCTDDEVTTIEQNVCSRWRLVTIPNTQGAYLKALDGTTPSSVTVSPPTFNGTSYTCVKVKGRCRPFAAKQPSTAPSASGPDKYILFFEIVYQEVGGIV